MAGVSDPVLRRRPARRSGAPVLDDAQSRVVRHPGGPLLVLAGPGTGKTTTLVEAVVDRVERRGLAPEQVLVLTFSRKAAQELRERVTARLGRTTRGALAMTFHSYAFALAAPRAGSGRRAAAAAAVRPRAGPRGGPAARGGARRRCARLAPGPAALAAPARVPARAARPAAARAGARRRRRRARGPGRAAATTGVGRRRALPRGLRGALRARPLGRGARPQRPGARGGRPARERRRAAGARAHGAGRRAGRRVPGHRSRRRSGCCRRSPATAATWWPSATPTRASTPSGAPTCAASSTCRDAFPTADGRPAPVVELRTCRRSGPALLAASRSVARRLPAGRLSPSFRELRARPRRRAVPAGSRSCSRPRRRGRPRWSPTSCGGPTCTTAWPGRDMAVLLRSTPRSLAVLRRGLHAAGVPVGVPADEVPLVEEPLVRALLDLLGAALRPAQVDADDVLALLSGPLVRADALAVRRLRRALREADLAAGGSAPVRGAAARGVPRPRAPARGPRPGARADRPAAAPGRRPCATAPARAARSRSCGRLWEASRGWRAGSSRTASAAAAAGRVADRALDAVLALFDAAARYVDRLPHASVLGFVDDVEAQEVPGRHAGPAHARGRRGAGDDGARQQGAGVVAGRRRRRAGGRVARPAAARLAARRRRPRRRRAVPRGGGRARPPGPTGAPSCSPRSAGCSTSRSRGPASGSSSRRSPAARATSGPAASSRSSASRCPNGSAPSGGR